MTQNRGAGKGNRAVPVGNHESAAGMSLRSCLVEVMAAKHLPDLPKRLRPLEFRLPFPVERESLSADGATGIGLLLGASAKYLHVPRPPLSTPEWKPQYREQ